MRYFFYLLTSLLFVLEASAQTKTDALFKTIFSPEKAPLFNQVISQPQKYRVQIIYTQINRDSANQPHFTNYYFNYNPENYFYPASIVKAPLAFLALEKLTNLQKRGVNKFTTVLFDSNQTWQHPLYTDTTAANGRPTIAHFIKRAFLISENDPYNRLYQFLGQEAINKKLHQKGYTDVRITRQFLGLTGAQNRFTNGLRFINRRGKTMYYQPPAESKMAFDFSHEVKLGKRYMNSKDSIINEPFNFTEQNALSLLSVQQMLQSVLFPQSVPAAQRFQLSGDDYRFLYQYLSQYPSETPDPKYDSTKFYDSYVKFFFRDSTGKMPPHVRVFNKVGWSYGFLTDVSYVADFENGVEYGLAATVYVNENETLNDGIYEYDSVGYPFLYLLGQAVYRFELARSRAFKPDLSAFKIEYEVRDKEDKRPSLIDVDN